MAGLFGNQPKNTSHSLENCRSSFIMQVIHRTSHRQKTTSHRPKKYKPSSKKIQDTVQKNQRPKTAINRLD